MENTANIGIRHEAKRLGIKQWEIAEAMGIGEGTLTRKLRRELPEEQRVKVLAAIQEIANRRKGGV